MMELKNYDDDFPLVSNVDNIKHNNRLKLLWLLLSFGIVLSIGSFIFLNHSGRTVVFFNYRGYPEIQNEDFDTCSGIPDLEKFDCFPDYPVSEQGCLSRGCCYHAVSSVKTNLSANPLNVPYCFYPSDYKGYSIISKTQDERHIIVNLKRVVPSGFPKDVSDVVLNITLIDDKTIRIKITDASSARFEVPLEINEDLGKINVPSYEIGIDSQNNLLITRKETGTVIFSASLSRLVYSDQFLQLSNRLPSPYIYGIGESYGPMLRNVNWTRITLLNSDREPIPHYPLYGSQPFYLSLESDGNANGLFLLNSNAMDVILQPTPAITFRPIGGILDLFIFLGPSPANVVQQYTSIVGRSAMPPYWSLGFHLCRFGYLSLNKTKETLQRNIDEKIPIDVQWNDIDYMDRYKDFTYDKAQFAGLPEFVDDLHAKGMHYVIMTDPGISNSEKPGTYLPYDEGAKENIFMKNPNGTFFVGKVWTDGTTVFPDFSHPNTTSYWTKQFENFYKEVKFDGVWIDMNEPSNFVDGGIDGCIDSTFEDPPYLPGSGEYKLRHKTACMTSKHFDTIHYNEHNLLGYREARATNMALRSVRGKRPFIISRATFAGQGVYSGHWSGDISSNWEDMRYTIPSTINFNLYGISMIGSDICGFNKNTSVELCARWQALGAFYPFSRNHNERVTIEQDPAALGPIVVDATRNTLNMRYILLPYLYTLFYRSHVFGETVVRPTFFEFPADKNTYSQDEQFMWGSAVLIVPALYPNVSSVTTYLPEGLWYLGILPDVRNSHGANFNFESNVTSIVTLFRGGYIVPCQYPGMTTTESRENGFLLAVFLNRSNEAEGELYWDDGDSLDTYEKKAYNLIKFTASKNVLSSKVLRSNFAGRMNLGAIALISINPAPSEVDFNGEKCSRKDLSESEENKQSDKNLFWFARHSSHKVTDGKKCLFVAGDYGGVFIIVSPTSLTVPFNVSWI